MRIADLTQYGELSATACGAAVVPD